MHSKLIYYFLKMIFESPSPSSPPPPPPRPSFSPKEPLFFWLSHPLFILYIVEIGFIIQKFSSQEIIKILKSYPVVRIDADVGY